MSTHKKEFKKKLNTIPEELFDEIAELFKKHGIDNIEVKDVKISPLDGPTQQECHAQGLNWYCRYRRDGSSYCWCGR